jgi:uncharacterized protein
MTKLLILVAAVVAIVWLLRRALAGPRKADAPPQAPGEPKGDLVNCAHCGVNLPKAEAYAASGVLPGAGGLHYCSEEHWRLGPRDG